MKYNVPVIICNVKLSEEDLKEVYPDDSKRKAKKKKKKEAFDFTKLSEVKK